MNSLEIQQNSRTRSRRYTLYRDRLLTVGFSEAEYRAGHFYLQAADQTAFIINLSDDEEGVFILYGFASAAYMAGDEEWLPRYGSDNDTCQVRNSILIYDENEASAEETITEFYNQYKNYSKDEILALKKERQKAFLDHFSRALKPLGFRKHGTKWTLDLHNGNVLSFHAQKSAFSDQYYFNVTVRSLSDSGLSQSYQRVVTCGKDMYNWQLMSEKQIEDLIKHTLDDYLSPIIMK